MKQLYIFFVTAILGVQVSVGHGVSQTPNPSNQPPTTISSQTPTTVITNKVIVSGLSAVEDGGFVSVSFRADVAADAATRGEVYVFSPVLSNGSYRVSLPAVVVRGKGTKRSVARRLWSAGESEIVPGAVYAANGQSVDYSAVVEAQEWMHGGSLYVEGATGGCCTYSEDGMVTLADNLRLYDDPVPVEVVTEIVRPRYRSIADSLSVVHSFVLPASQFDPADPFRVRDDERETALIVYFHQSKHDIDRSYRNNGHTLSELTDAVNAILGDRSSNVERIVIAGFASPEGSFSLNDRLSFNRAVAVKGHILRTTRMRDEQVMVFNGGEDWNGLRYIVEKSAMKDRQAVLDIIDNTPIWDSRRNVGRLGQLMRLNGGDTYRYMLREIFPLLRNGAFIKVYYNESGD